MLTADAFGILPPIARLTPRAGDVLLPLRLHGEARRHRDRRQGAAADLLRLLRRAVPAAAADGLRAAARREARRARLDGLARQHGLDGRPVRRGRADADRGDARAPARGALRRAGRRRVPDRRALRLRGAGRRAGRRLEAARPALDVARPGGLRREGARARDVPRQLREVRRDPAVVAAARASSERGRRSTAPCVDWKLLEPDALRGATPRPTRAGGRARRDVPRQLREARRRRQHRRRRPRRGYARPSGASSPPFG